MTLNMVTLRDALPSLAACHRLHTYSSCVQYLYQFAQGVAGRQRTCDYRKTGISQTLPLPYVPLSESNRHRERWPRSFMTKDLATANH